MHLSDFFLKDPIHKTHKQNKDIYVWTLGRRTKKKLPKSLRIKSLENRKSLYSKRSCAYTRFFLPHLLSLRAYLTYIFLFCYNSSSFWRKKNPNIKIAFDRVRSIRYICLNNFIIVSYIFSKRSYHIDFLL